MEEWKDLEEELKELEEDFLSEDELLRHLITPSAADYWKKRVEEDKSDFGRLLQIKEEEKEAVREELKNTRSQMEALSQKIRNLEDKLREEASSWEKKLKEKDIEFNNSK